MSDLVIEIGFDWNAGSLGRLVGDESLDLFPLQHGIARIDEESGEAVPLWPTQMRVGDGLRFLAFDITRDPLPPRDEPAVPVRFEAHFSHPNEPEKPRNIFREPTEVPIVVEAADVRPQGELFSPVYGGLEKSSPGRGRFHCFGLGAEGADQHFLKETELELERSFMTLVLVVRRGQEERTFVLDPEVYVGPFGDRC